MTLRSIPDTIEALRIILFKFEQALDRDYDQAALSELKRIILDRIAELEAERAMKQRCAPRSASQLEALEVAAQDASQDKLSRLPGSSAD